MTKPIKAVDAMIKFLKNLLQFIYQFATYSYQSSSKTFIQINFDIKCPYSIKTLP